MMTSKFTVNKTTKQQEDQEFKRGARRIIHAGSGRRSSWCSVGGVSGRSGEYYWYGIIRPHDHPPQLTAKCTFEAIHNTNIIKYTSCSYKKMPTIMQYSSSSSRYFLKKKKHTNISRTKHKNLTATSQPYPNHLVPTVL